MIEPRSHIPIPKPTKGPKKARKGIKRATSERKARTAAYMRQRDRFLNEHRYCQHWLAEHGFKEDDVSCGMVEMGDNCWVHVPISCEIHHKAGRNGRLLLDERYWMAVRPGHAFYIHGNMKEAREKGYVIDLTYEQRMAI